MEDDCVVDVVVQRVGLMQLQLFLHRLLWFKTVLWQVAEGRQSIRPGLRRQAGTIRNEAGMIDVYQKEISTKYTNKLGDLKKRLQELGLEVDGKRKRSVRG